jgi:LacI family transcriptional regulator, gluconate utilization system Gnt-I transcriptional repressor
MAGRRTRASATVTDVARVAGVSPITVSRALSAPERLSAKTLERVRTAVRSTGYVPNLLAGGLRSAKSRLVAAVVPTVAGPVFLDTIQALTDALDARGYQLMLGQSGYRHSREDALLDAIIGRRPTGIVLTGLMHSPEGRRRLVACGIPVVETWDLTPKPIDMLVGFSHERIGESVAQFLQRRGHRRPAIISGNDPRAVRRTESFTGASRGIVPVEWVDAPTTLESGRSGLARLLERAPQVDAIFCSSDLLALGVITEARVRGLAIPGKLAVVGFGDLQLLAGVAPAITTVRIDGKRMGRLAAELIIERAEGRRVKQPVIDVGFSIIERASA